jgi:hypothetical protein
MLQAILLKGPSPPEIRSRDKPIDNESILLQVWVHNTITTVNIPPLPDIHVHFVLLSSVKIGFPNLINTQCLCFLFLRTSIDGNLQKIPYEGKVVGQMKIYSTEGFSFHVCTQETKPSADPERLSRVTTNQLFPPRPKNAGDPSHRCIPKPSLKDVGTSPRPDNAVSNMLHQPPKIPLSTMFPPNLFPPLHPNTPPTQLVLRHPRPS